MRIFLLLVLLAWCLCSAAEPVNLTPNPSFEQAAEGMPVDWTPEPAGAV